MELDQPKDQIMAKYTRITYHERLRIRHLLNKKKSLGEIAKKLRRSKSTISDEIRRKGMTAKAYNPILAQSDKKFRDRLRGRKKKIFGPLKELIHFLMLEYHWSPEQISNRLKLNYPELDILHISHEGIYQYVYTSPIRKFLTMTLRSKRKKRGRKKHNGFQRGGIKNHVSIHKRSRAALDRSEVGHWESDLIIGGHQKGAIGTIVDRATRYTILVPLESKHTRHVVQRFSEALNAIPSHLRKSITHDHGSEMTHHERLALLSGISVYFADPGCPWQRPTNENTNGLIREFFPKRSDLSLVTSAEQEKVQTLLNNRPRKCLGFKTPREVLEEVINEKGTLKPPLCRRTSVIRRLSVGVQKYFSLASLTIQRTFF